MLNKYTHEYNVSIVVRIFTEDMLYTIKNAKYSTASLNEFEKMIFSIPNDYYVICPLYQDDTGYDFQIGVSGSVKNNETYFDAAKREIGEEVGLCVPDTKIFDYREQKFIYNINTMYDVPLKYNNKHINNQPDARPKQKVMAIIYGTEIEVDQYLTQPNIYRYADGDNIVGVGKMKVEDIKNYLSKKSKIDIRLKPDRRSDSLSWRR